MRGMSAPDQPLRWAHEMSAAPELIEGETYWARWSEAKDGDDIDLEVYIGSKSELVRVRLYGIDAPEHDQPLGSEAKAP